MDEHENEMMSRLEDTRNEMQKLDTKMETNHLEIKSQVNDIGMRCEESTTILKEDKARISDQVKKWKETVDDIRKVRENINQMQVDQKIFRLKSRK